jgi:hypothetical protein
MTLREPDAVTTDNDPADADWNVPTTTFALVYSPGATITARGCDEPETCRAPSTTILSIDLMSSIVAVGTPATIRRVPLPITMLREAPAAVDMVIVDPLTDETTPNDPPDATSLRTNVVRPGVVPEVCATDVGTASVEVDGGGISDVGIPVGATVGLVPATAASKSVPFPFANHNPPMPASARQLSMRSPANTNDIICHLDIAKSPQAAYRIVLSRDKAVVTLL